jgi:hypothetical protein
MAINLVDPVRISREVDATPPLGRERRGAA